MKKIKNFGFKVLRLVLQIILFPLFALPYSWQWGFSGLIARLIIKFNAKRKRVMLLNLNLVFPDMPETEKIIIMQKSVTSFAMVFFDFINAMYITNIKKSAELEFENKEAESFIQDGKILLSAHFGSILYGLFLSQMIDSLKTGYAPVREEGMLDFAGKLFNLPKVKILAHKNIDVLGMLADIKNDAGIFFAYDQWVGRPLATDGELFGRKTGVMKFTPILVKRFIEEPIYFVIHTRTNHRYGKFKIYKRYFDKSLTREEILIELQKMLEKLVIENRDSWWWIHDRWKEPPSDHTTKFQDLSKIVGSMYKNNTL